MRRRRKVDDDSKSVSDNLYFEDLVTEKEIYDWHEDLIIHELSGKNINLFYEIIEQRTLDEVWRMIALKRANEQ